MCFTSSRCGSLLVEVTPARGVKDCRLYCEQGRVDSEAVNCNDDDENLYIQTNRIIQKNNKTSALRLNVRHGSVDEQRCAPGTDDHVARVAAAISVMRAAEDEGHIILGGERVTDTPRVGKLV